MEDFKFVNGETKKIKYLEKKLSIKLIKAIIVTNNNTSIANLIVKCPTLRVKVYPKFQPPYTRVFELYSTFDDKTLNPIVSFSKNEHLGYKHNLNVVEMGKNSDYIDYIEVTFTINNEIDKDYVYLVTDNISDIEIC